MKKILLLAAAAVFTVTSSVAQSVKKFDPEAQLKKIERSNEDIANDKKNGKPAVWLNRGELFIDAGAGATEYLYKGMDVDLLTQAYGANPQVTTETVDRDQYTVYVYPNFKAYLTPEGLVAFYRPLVRVVENPFETSFEAYKRAYEVDPKSAPKVREGLLRLANEYKRTADNYFTQHDFERTADAFAGSYEVQLHPAVNMIDTASLYNAGLFYTFANDFEKGEKYLEKALGYNYEDEGNIYFYLYHSYYGAGNKDKAMDILHTGIRKYPTNSSIVEGLVTLYSNTEGVDPTAIVPLVLASIEQEPDNHLLWSGLGGVYNKLGEFDKAIEAYEKSVELRPDDFVNNYRLGYAFVEHGDELNKELNSGNVTSTKEYNEGLEKVNDTYARSIPALEKAHQLNPSHGPTIILLKNITFRLRERDGIGEKYEYFNELFNQLEQ